jgi:uncharacterized protein YlxW (UPF0749 family)
MSTEEPREEGRSTAEEERPTGQGDQRPAPEDDVEATLEAEGVQASAGEGVEPSPAQEGVEPGPAEDVEPTSEDEEEDEDDGEGPQQARDPGGAWRRLLRAGSPRATRANLLAMVLAGSLGFAIIAQVRQTSTEGLENLREDDLVRIFAGLDRDGDRLTEDIRELEASLERLRSQTTNDEEAQRSAQQRLDSLGILAGTAPASGPGIVLTIRDPERQVTAPLLLDAVQELRGAGAEAIQVGDVRVVADTWFTQADDGISVSGTVVRSPYVVRAIGDANTLAGAMEIPGGVTATVRRAGGESDIQIREDVEVDALLSPSPPQYARPVPTPTS